MCVCARAFTVAIQDRIQRTIVTGAFGQGEDEDGEGEGERESGKKKKMNTSRKTTQKSMTFVE